MCFLWSYILSIVNYTKGCRCHVSVILITPTVLCFTECPFPQNAAMFPVDDPTSPPLIGPSTIVVVNDARHQLQPDFLQRTTPYFFDVDENSGQYKWAKVHNSFIHWLVHWLMVVVHVILGFQMRLMWCIICHFFPSIPWCTAGGIRSNASTFQERFAGRPFGKPRSFTGN